MTIIFFGSDPWFSPPVLETLLSAGFEVPVAVTKGDAIDEGRRKKEEGKRKIKIIRAKESKDISLNSLMSAFGLARPDAIVLAAFGPPFLAAEVLQWPKYGCLNVHASLLPRWRGASPVFASLREGDKETGVSVMRMTEEIDKGPVLKQRKILVKQGVSLLKLTRSLLVEANKESPVFDTRETLTKRLGKLGGKLIVETLKKLEKGQISEVKQPLKSPTPYTRRLTKVSGRIDWSQSPIEIERFIRAALPWPSAMSNVKFKIKNEEWQTIQNVKILKAHLEPIRYSVFPARRRPRPMPARLWREPCSNRTQRRMGSKGGSIRYSLVIDKIQLPGKNPITWKQFLAGRPGVVLC